MKISEDIKLDFSDVLIRPKRSNISSRSQVELNRVFRFPHSTRELNCVPIMAANMDTVGTFEIAEEFSKESMITCLMKHYTVEQLVEWGKKVEPSVLNNVAVAAGTSDHDF